jgi:hypothetical protein
MSAQQIEFLSRTATLQAGTNRQLSGQTVIQPVIQSGTATTTAGASGSIVVTLPVAYTTSAYNVQVTHQGDSSTAQMSITSQTASGFTIYFTQAGATVTTKSFYWNTFGL